MSTNTAFKQTKDFPEQISTRMRLRSYMYEIIGSYISSFSKYYEKTIQLSPRVGDDSTLLSKIASKHTTVCKTASEIQITDQEERTLVLLNGNLNYDLDIEQSLSELKKYINRRTRLVLVLFNPYYRFLYFLADKFGLRNGPPADTFITLKDLKDILELSGYSLVKVQPLVYFPFRLWGVGDIVNRCLKAIPLLRWFSLSSVVICRPIFVEQGKPSLSIVIPARNEQGNIENALKRLPDFDGAEKEVIFVEGHSSDNTWEEILRVQKEYKNQISIKAFQQTGKGKSDAVRLGFANATGDLLTILDADLTMPPELLPRFYNAYCKGLADFINGSRLVYPMEGEAMRFLNHLGNIFFAKALSFVLDMPLSDSLCGTKLLSRDDYRRFIDWRSDFGDFDPFGDFELLFPASELNLGLINIPIRYRDRTYGSTNISRFRHGLMLMKMTLIGLLRIKLR